MQKKKKNERKVLSQLYNTKIFKLSLGIVLYGTF